MENSQLAPFLIGFPFEAATRKALGSLVQQTPPPPPASMCPHENGVPSPAYLIGFLPQCGCANMPQAAAQSLLLRGRRWCAGGRPPIVRGWVCCRLTYTRTKSGRWR